MSDVWQQTFITLGAMAAMTLGAGLLAIAVIKWIYRPQRKTRGKRKGKRERKD
jgi:cbb3-type cytochrome oxidase subunit 3